MQSRFGGERSVLHREGTFRPSRREKGDTVKDADYIVDKIIHLRIFEDEAGKLNLSLLDIKGELSIVSQFTLYGDARHGRRPSFTEAEAPDRADELYRLVVENVKRKA